ncbi:MAG: hypothetical protein K1X86_10605 [Ignavibacteria bacterium]|nr:hypothetical protein [Ignavibacteria bacterium]
MSIETLRAFAINKENFNNLNDYIKFATDYLTFISDNNNIQATIVSQNENHYKFLQYKEDGTFNITRPLNSDLFYSLQDFAIKKNELIALLGNIRAEAHNTEAYRTVLNRSIYTIQQCIGAALDALPANQSNTAKKINGDLFERLICLLFNMCDISCSSGEVPIAINFDNDESFTMTYQHDLIVKQGSVVKAIGSVKTSSKDRIDKVFLDKFLYSRLTETTLPHFAVFLNDVQRKNVRSGSRYGVSQTFLPGKFKAYTVKLNPLNGVYYCDIRPIMLSDNLLHQHIKTFDHLLFEDIWGLL